LKVKNSCELRSFAWQIRNADRFCTSVTCHDFQVRRRKLSVKGLRPLRSECCNGGKIDMELVRMRYETVISNFYAKNSVAIGKARAPCAQSLALRHQATIEFTCHDHSPRTLVITFNRSHFSIGRASTPRSLY